MKTALNISPELQLPLDLITETAAIIAKRGVGKTYTASVITEELLKAGGHVIAIDPVGVWWGLRASAQGEPEGGLQVLILGGGHGDLPLDPNSGRAVADLIVDERLSCVLDLSLMMQEEAARFLAPFLERLYQINRAPLHLMVDEADSIAPQVPGRGESVMLAAMDRIVRRGRARGLGVTLITQRPAVLSKNVLTQIELLITLRLTSPNDRKAIDGWIQAQGTEDERRAVMASLATLEVGEAWFWSPAWLGLLKRVRIRQRQTFDSSATPKVGQTLAAPRTLASIDLSALKERFSGALVAAAENDPEQLHRRIASLEQQLRDRPTEQVVERVEVPVLRSGEVERLEQAAEGMTAMGKDLLSVAGEIRAVLAKNSNPAPPLPSVPLPRQLLAPRADASSPSATSSVVHSDGITAPQQRILNALASFKALGLHQVARNNVAVWADQSPTSSGYGNNLGRLRTMGHIEYPNPGFVALTEVGCTVATAAISIHTVHDLHSAWLARLPRPQGRILAELLASYPNAMARHDLAHRSGQSPTSSGFGNNLGHLRSLGLINYYPPRSVVATNLVFPDNLPPSLR